MVNKSVKIYNQSLAKWLIYDVLANWATFQFKMAAPDKNNIHFMYFYK